MTEPAYSAIVEAICLLDDPDRLLELTLRGDGGIQFNAEDADGSIELALSTEELERIHRAIGHLLYMQAEL